MNDNVTNNSFIQTTAKPTSILPTTIPTTASPTTDEPQSTQPTTSTPSTAPGTKTKTKIVSTMTYKIGEGTSSIGITPSDNNTDDMVAGSGRSVAGTQIDNITLIIAASGGGFFLVIIFIALAVVILYRREQRSTKKKSNDSTKLEVINNVVDAPDYRIGISSTAPQRPGPQFSDIQDPGYKFHCQLCIDRGHNNCQGHSLSRSPNVSRSKLNFLDSGLYEHVSGQTEQTNNLHVYSKAKFYQPEPTPARE